MIQVSGYETRSFIIPAELPMAFAYYSDLGRILTYLPHISLVRAYSHDQFRVLYSTMELGIYHIRIFCDLQACIDERERSLILQPMTDVPQVHPSAGAKSATTQGYYRSKSVFRDTGSATSIEYSLELEAALPTPLGLRLAPGHVVNRVAHDITLRRTREIADGFVERSIDAFPGWLAEMGQRRLPSL